MSAAISPVFAAKHSYRLEVIDGPEKGRLLYSSTFDRALKDADDLRYHTGSRSRIVSVFSGDVLWQHGEERLRG